MAIALNRSDSKPNNKPTERAQRCMKRERGRGEAEKPLQGIERGGRVDWYLMGGKPEKRERRERREMKEETGRGFSVRGERSRGR